MSSSPDEPDAHRSRALWLVIVAAVLVIGLGIVLGIVLLGGSGGGANNAGGARTGAATHTSAPHRTSRAPSHSASHTSSPPEPTTTKPAPPKTKTKSTHPHPRPQAPTDQDLVNAVTEYYNYVPTDLDAGWDRLTPHFQEAKAGGRANYDSYWNTVSRVDVANAQAQPPSSAVATLTYYYKNGQVKTERTMFTFKRQAGVLKIDETEIVG